MIKNKIMNGRGDTTNASSQKTTAASVYLTEAGKISRLPSWLIQVRPATGKLGVIIPLYLLLSGCFAPPIIPTDAELQHISTLLIVPVEAPPLEIIPDPIYDRLPVYRHYNNMSLSIPQLPEKTYQNPGGVVIVGRVDPGEPYQEVKRVVDPKLGASLDPLGPAGQSWMPTRVLSQNAVSQLNEAKVNAILSERFYRLPITNDHPLVSMKGWHDAIMDWYGLNQATVDYHQPGNNSIDAVVEIAIGNYRVFESQTSLQVFVKLIDLKTGRVLARSREHGYVVGNEALSLFHSDSEPFKQLITDLGIGLLRDGFRNIGLLQKTV